MTTAGKLENMFDNLSSFGRMTYIKWTRYIVNMGRFNKYGG